MPGAPLASRLASRCWIFATIVAAVVAAGCGGNSTDSGAAAVAGGGDVPGCVASGATSAITLPATATMPSRTTGVAPLAVFFDATGTTASGSAAPFHELEYRWSFGDPAGGAAWAYGSGAHVNHKNAATGAVAAHVFETPGTYTVSLTVTDGSDTVSNSCISITAQDPNTVYSGPSTRCYSTVGSFAGCPAGAETVTDAAGDFDAAINSDLATGKRLLFNRGETWFTSAAARLKADGPWTIGAYGSGAKPVVQWAGGTTILAIGSSGADLRDGRVMDLALEGTTGGATVMAADGIGTFDQLTFLRIDVANTLHGFVLSLTKPALIRAWDQLTIADSTVGPLQAGSGGNGMFLSASRMAILGNSIDNQSGAEHNFRSMYFHKLVLANNRLARPAPTKANITLRAPDWATGTGPVAANTYSQYAMVADNELVGATGVQVPVNTSIDSGHDARTRNIVFERNWWHDQPDIQTALNLNSDFTTARNNLMDLSAGTGTGGTCIVVSNNGGPSPNPTTNWLYNNTCFSSRTFAGFTSKFRGINLFATAVDTSVRNNLVYAPNASVATTNVLVVTDSGTGTLGASGTFGNASDAQARIDPLFAVLSSPLTPANAKPATGSFAIGSGVIVRGEVSDFFGNAQTLSPDIGAVRH